MEEWRDIPGFEGRYQVSDEGRIRGTKGILRCQINNSGYLVVNLYLCNARSVRLVHRLVAERFLPPVFGKDYVNHRDGNKQNNARLNLEWCTPSENSQHAYDTKLRTPPAHAVRGRHVESGVVVVFASQRDAERALSRTGKQSSAIHHCLVGNKKSAYGYCWERAT